MDWTANCSAVIPCFNEERTIRSLVKAVQAHLPTVFVVDDGCTDNTAAEARRAGALVLCHRQNRGKGAALATGWSAARQRGFAWALTLDGDGQHSAGDIPSFLRCAETASVKLVVGNRMEEMSDMPWLRRCANRWMSRRISSLAGQVFPDSQCGYRLLSLDAWARMPIHSSHFEIESELLLACARTGCGIGFVPILSIYKDEQSKIHLLRDTLRWLRWYHRARQLPSLALNTCVMSINPP